MKNFRYINNLNYLLIEGLISDLKWINQALWTSNFTPPTKES